MLVLHTALQILAKEKYLLKSSRYFLVTRAGIEPTLTA